MRKYYRHDQVLEFCFRVEEGLPFVPNALTNMLIEGVTARALELYELKLCAMVWMTNHVHLIIVVDNPCHVAPFCAYIKGETSHIVNKLLGRRQKTNWVKGTKSPLYLLTPEVVKKRLAYLYNNPTKANYEDVIERHPGVSSWNSFIGKEQNKLVYKVSRDSIPRLSAPAISISEAKRRVEELKRKKTGVRQLKLKYQPNAWMSSFRELEGADAKEINADVISVIRKNESKYRYIRKSKNKEVIGATNLQRQNMLKEYIPKKYTQTKKILANTQEQEQIFIQFLNWIFETGRQIYQRWKKGEIFLQMPAGLIAPRLPTLLCAWSA